MQNLASAELKLIKHQASLSNPLQGNPDLVLNTARKTGQFLGATEKDTILVEIFKTLVALSSIISANPLLSLKGVVKTANTALIGKQYGSVILEYYISTTVEDSASHAAPVLMTATLTGKHIGNTLPSIPRLLGIQKAEIVSNTSSFVRTLPAISVGLITERGLYNGALNGNELRFITHAVSQTALPQGQIEYDLDKGTLSPAFVIDGERPGKEQILAQSPRISSAISQISPELSRAIKEGQMPLSGESKFDEMLTIEIGKSWVFDEQIILTVSRAREFLEKELLRSPRNETIVETHKQLELLKSIVEKVFVLVSSIEGKEQLLSSSLRYQSTVGTQPHLGLLTAKVSGQLVRSERPEKLRQFGLSNSQHIESSDIANTLPGLRSAIITGKVMGKDLNVIPQEIPLLRSHMQDSSILSPMDSPILLQCGSLSGAFFGSGSQRSLRELLCINGAWLGSFRFDLMVQLTPCRSFEETVKIFPRTLCDEVIILTATPTGIVFDRQLYLWKTADQPALTWLTVESPDICFTKGDIAIEHPAITMIEFYDTSDALLDTIINLTDLTAGKIVTRKSKTFDLKKTLAYVKVTTADGRVHTVKI